MFQGYTVCTLRHFSLMLTSNSKESDWVPSWKSSFDVTLMFWDVILQSSNNFTNKLC